MTMGERIKELRKMNNLSQEELATMLGLKKAAISKYEKGIVSNMKQSVIKKMADIFGVTPSYLMCLDDAPTIDINDLISEKPEMKVLLDIAKDASPEELSTYIKLIKALREK